MCYPLNRVVPLWTENYRDLHAGPNQTRLQVVQIAAAGLLEGKTGSGQPSATLARCLTRGCEVHHDVYVTLKLILYLYLLFSRSYLLPALQFRGISCSLRS